MKNLIWIVGLLFFVDYSTRIDLSIKKVFSITWSTDKNCDNLADEENAEEDKGESEDDGFDEKTIINEQLSLYLYHYLDFHKMAICRMAPSPSYDIESPPPKL